MRVSSSCKGQATTCFPSPFRRFLRNLSLSPLGAHLPFCLLFYSTVSLVFFFFFSLLDSFPGYWRTYARVAGSCGYLRTRGVDEGGKKREFLGATVDLTPEKNRATPDVDRGLTDFSPANSEIGEEPAFV